MVMPHASRQRQWSTWPVLGASILAIASGCTTMAAQGTHTTREEASVVAAERARLRALVIADMDGAERLHAPDFHLINPLGRALSRAEYLASVASGESDYFAWEPESIAVRVRGPLAAIRYRSRVDMAVRGQRLPTMEAWNTGLYERRNGRWLIVWFQVTQVVPPRP